MHQEAGESGLAVQRLIAANSAAIRRLAGRLRLERPPVVVTYARGSSDHAATHAKYLIETLVGVPVSSGAASVASIYGSLTVTPGAVCLAISQSGRSPDILAGVEAHKRAGNLVIGFVNDEHSPLAQMSDVLIPLCAGPERSVAATKSYIASLAGVALLVAAWVDDTELQAAVLRLPEQLPEAFELHWSDIREDLVSVKNLFVLGRGYSLAAAQEAALKLKETCALHAEAFSAAEVRHGPMTIVGKDFPILGFATSDAAGDGVGVLGTLLSGRGARVRIADPARRIASGLLPALRTHPAVEPILMIQSFYRMVNELSLARGLDPDAPPHLLKVTRTT